MQKEIKEILKDSDSDHTLDRLELRDDLVGNCNADLNDRVSVITLRAVGEVLDIDTRAGNDRGDGCKSVRDIMVSETDSCGTRVGDGNGRIIYGILDVTGGEELAKLLCRHNCAVVLAFSGRCAKVGNAYRILHTTSLRRGEVGNVSSYFSRLKCNLDVSGVNEIGTGKVGSALSETGRKFTDGSIKMSWTAALSIDESLGAEALLLSSPTATLEVGGKTVDREGCYALIGYGERESDGETSRVVVVPSIYLTENDAMISNAYANRDFLYALLDTLDADAQTMPYHCRMSIVTQTTLENLTVGTARIMTALILLLPVPLTVTGAVVLLRRKYR